MACCSRAIKGTGVVMQGKNRVLMRCYQLFKIKWDDVNGLSKCLSCNSGPKRRTSLFRHSAYGLAA